MKPRHCSVVILQIQIKLTLIVAVRIQCFAAVSSVDGNMSHWWFMGQSLGSSNRSHSSIHAFVLNKFFELKTIVTWKKL